MRYVVKLGGAALESAAETALCARGIAELVRDGHSVAVVHGGGAALTRTLKALGKESTFIAGLRVTDAETRDAALMVLAGIVNKKLVAALGAAGVPAIGFSGADGLAFRARKKVTAPDLGFVGEIAATDTRWLDAVWQFGGVPVISSMALGFDGEFYNVNADEMAGACAVACRADALIFLTDVAGVRGREGVVLRWLPIAAMPQLAAENIISGGMLPKLGACREALLRGVKRVRILPAQAAADMVGLGSQHMEHGTEVLVA